MLPLLSCCAGVYLGLRFNILALLPFSILGAGAYISSSWSAGQSLSHSAIVLLFPMISIQAGYMVGLTARGAYGQLLERLNIRQSKQV
jgi:nitric oxide reductase large subunit